MVPVRMTRAAAPRLRLTVAPLSAASTLARATRPRPSNISVSSSHNLGAAMAPLCRPIQCTCTHPDTDWPVAARLPSCHNHAGITVQRHRRKSAPACFSPACRQNSLLSGWGSNVKCYSRSCPYANGQPRRSYWNHPKLTAMLLRAKIVSSIGLDNMSATLQPFSSFAPRILHGRSHAPRPSQVVLPIARA